MPARQDSSFALQGTKFSHVIASACLSRMKKLIEKHLLKYISINRRYFYSVFTTHNTSICEKKKLTNVCGISSIYRSSHPKSSAKQEFLKISQHSQENNCFGVSLQAFRFAILLIRDTNTYVFRRILWNFKEHHFEEQLRTTASYFMNKNRNNPRKKFKSMEIYGFSIS